MVKVSVIIPFYNVENYIEECLNSVVNQTLKDIEIILVNDASSDESLKIVQKFIQKDKRIILLNKDATAQKGQGYARNLALDVAKGEYIGFVDSDDYIKPEMFEKLYSEAKKNDTDITMCQADEYNDTTGVLDTSPYYLLDVLKLMRNEVFSAIDTKKQILDINVAIWNKIYKREFFEKNKIRFPQGFIYEDLPFFFETYLKAERINIIWEILYTYRTNRKNSTMNQFNNKVLDRPYMVSLTYEHLKKVPFFEEIKNDVIAWIINDLFHRYTILEKGYQKEFFFLMKKLFLSLDVKNKDDSYWLTVYHFNGYLKVIEKTFEEFNQYIFNEYLDIHEVEERLKCEVSIKYEIFAKISAVYDEITKNYKYTDGKNNELREHVDLIVKNIYEDLSKNYDYTYNLMEENRKKIEIQTNGQVTELYNEISKNYDYTNNLVKELQDKILSCATEMPVPAPDNKYDNNYGLVNNYRYLEQDIAYIGNCVNQNEENFKNEIEKLSTEIKSYEEIKNSIDEFLFNNNNLKNIIDSTRREIFDKFANIENMIPSMISDLEKKANVYSDIKANSLYDELSKNYDYTEEIVLNAKNELESKFISIGNEIRNNTNENIIGISDKLNKFNLETIEKVENTKKELFENVKEISQNTEEIRGLFNDRINELLFRFEQAGAEQKTEKEKLTFKMDELSKDINDKVESNNELLNRYKEELNRDLKDFAFIFNDNNAEYTKKLNRSMSEIKQNAEDINYVKSKFISDVKNVENRLNSVKNETQSEIKSLNEEYLKIINSLKEDIQNERTQHYNILESLKKKISDTEEINNQQRNEIDVLKEELRNTKEILYERTRNPIEKLFKISKKEINNEKDISNSTRL